MKPWKKYLIEFFVIMLGILAAIQFENWNQDRKDRSKEQLLLKELHDEFLLNKSQFENVVEAHNQTLKACHYYLNIQSLSNSKINQDTLMANTMLFYYNYTFNPSQGIINTIMNSSNIDLISNNELRKSIITWNDIIKDFQEEELASRDLLNNLVYPYFVERFSMTNPEKRLSAIKNEKFINIVYHRIAYLDQILNSPENELDKVRKAIDEIIRLTANK